MNPESTSNNSSSGGPATPINNRKERGAIAAQACESCRQRKQRCSEERPKCATCQVSGRSLPCLPTYLFRFHLGSSRLPETREHSLRSCSTCPLPP
ncbi:hypothetical protein GGR54DRAFT_89178 [Hypoxylon sp. NC1633]|nr:hypothetical protein GGR54DRAFT_89178 [Hypoxylon sp. NC1633]